MDSAWLGLAGVVVGSATSYAATWTSSRSGANELREERIAARAQRFVKSLVPRTWTPRRPSSD